MSYTLVIDFDFIDMNGFTAYAALAMTVGSADGKGDGGYNLTNIGGGIDGQSATYLSASYNSPDNEYFPNGSVIFDHNGMSFDTTTGDSWNICSYDGSYNINDLNSGAYAVSDFRSFAICYVRGTNILTPIGNVPVESIAIGDLLVTRFGGIRPVKWIGRQSYDVRFLRNNPAKRPVRIRAGALQPGMPARDLLVSPGHSLLLGDTLVLASALINGVTIIQEPASDTAATLDYFQIEFATHDCVIAEGTWAESYADGPGLRGQFHNAADFFARYPDDAPPEALFLCAPRPERGAELDAALRPVAARAATGIAPGRLEGFVDLVRDRDIHGWAMDTAHPDLPVLLDILLDGTKLGSVLACDAREDLRGAGKGSGRCAFAFTTPRQLPADALSRLTVCRAADGAPLAVTDVCLGRAPTAAPVRRVA